jgi:4-amino-4-deoxy-L-arabinose transferase-like glycosyltransferase
MTAVDEPVLSPAEVPPAPDAPTDPYPEPRDRRRFGWWMLGIGLVAAAVRWMNVFWWRPTTNKPGYHGYRLGGDAFYYHWQANALAKGAWFVDPYVWHYFHGKQRPSATHPPLYVTYLSLWSRLGLTSVTWHRFASTFLGIAAVVMIGYLGRRIGGNTVGIVAAGIAAVYPEMWINDGMLLSEPSAILMTAIALYTMYNFARKPSVRNAVWMGLAVGITALSRTELTLLFVVAVIPIALMARRLSWKDRFLRIVVAGAMGALCLVPWMLFNYTRFAEPTTMTSATGAALSASACDQTFSGWWLGYYYNCFQGPWPKASLDESQRDLVPRKQAIKYLENHKRELPKVLFARVGRMWGFFRPGQTTFLDWWLEGRGRAPSWIGLYMYYALMPFAIGGLVVLHKRRITIIPMLAVAAIATFAAALTFGVTRYRAPAEVAIVTSAAVGLVAAWQWLARRRAANQAANQAEVSTTP